MTTTHAEARRRYRHLMRQHAKATATDQAENMAIGEAFLAELARAGMDVDYVHWFDDEPIIQMADGWLVQDLRTGAIAVHARAAAHGCAGAQHHKAHQAETPAEAVWLLSGPVAQLSETARILSRRTGQEGMDMTKLYRSAMDQKVRLNPDPTAASRRRDGLALLAMLKSQDIAVESVTVENEGVWLRLPRGSIIQKREGGYRVGYSPVSEDGRQDYRLAEGEVPTPEEAVTVYIAHAVPKAAEVDAERRRAREARQAKIDAERQRQERVIAEYEALPAEVRAAARVVVDYLEIALSRTGSPLAMIISPMSASPQELLDRVERDGMPPFAGAVRRASFEQEARDILKVA